MRRFTAFAVVLCFGSLLGTQVFGQSKSSSFGVVDVKTPNEPTDFVPATQRSCGSLQKMEQSLAEHPELRAEYESIQYNEAQMISQNAFNKVTGVITIPVVVHVLYRTTAGNISQTRVQEQIDVLNLDYARQNADTTLTPAGFKSVAGDCQIQFCLATRDPQGNTTDGIIRTQTTTSNIGNTNQYYGATNGSPAWDRTKYMNIWVCEIGGGILGFAYKPGTAPASYDGIVIDYRYFGKTGASAPFNRGRTATHEVGHWLGLDHIWGDDGNACSGSDGVADTPNQADEYYNCPTFPQFDACTPSGNGNMFMNYMDYVNDACMNMFTQGQCAKMNTALSGTRGSLALSNGCSGPGNPTVCDSATLGDPLNGTVVLYGVSGSGSWGYVGGHNNYLDKAKASYYANAQGYLSCTGIDFEFGAAAAASGTSKVTCKIWDEVGGQPGTVLASRDLLISDIISGSGVASVTFTTPATLSGAFFAGFEMTYVAGDTVAILTNSDGDATPNTAWEQFSDNSWHAFDETGTSWGISVDLAIFPRVEGAGVAVSVTPNNPTILQGNSTPLTASGAATYTWAPPTGLSSSFGASVTASPSVTTTYTVTGTDASGQCTGTSQVTVTVIPNVGVEDALFGGSDLKLFPNPNNGTFQLSFNQLVRKDMEITVSNMIGQKVFQRSLNRFEGEYNETISLGSSAKGVYFVKVSDGVNQMVKKVVVE